MEDLLKINFSFPRVPLPLLCHAEGKNQKMSQTGADMFIIRGCFGQQEDDLFVNVPGGVSGKRVLLHAGADTRVWPPGFRSESDALFPGRDTRLWAGGHLTDKMLGIRNK